MLIVSIFSFIALLLTILDSKKVIDWGMKCGFLIIGLIAVIHYDFGNDYMSYFRVYQTLLSSNFSLSQIGEEGVIRNNEYGWAILNMLFFPLGKYGFFGLVAAISIFENYVYFHFIKKYVPREWWWLAVFIYLFSTSLYLMNMSMLRQGVVSAAFVLIYPWIMDKRIIRCAVVWFLLTTIHTSSFVLLPLIFIGFLPSRKSGKFYVILLCTIFVLFWVSGSVLSEIFQRMSDLDQFSIYADQYKNAANGNVKYGLGFVINMIPFIVILNYLISSKIEHKTFGLLILSSLGYILLPMVNYYGAILGRISYYFLPYKTLTVPITYGAIKQSVIRTVLLGLLLAIISYDYIIFFNNPVWTEHFSTYHTIFEAKL